MRAAALAFGLIAAGGFIFGGTNEPGPPIGTRLPEFELRDQTGKARTLKSLLGSKGAVIVFFRSADW